MCNLGTLWVPFLFFFFFEAFRKKQAGSWQCPLSTQMAGDISAVHPHTLLPIPLPPGAKPSLPMIPIDFL